MKNYIYCRVSSEKQADYLKGHTSLQVQQNALYNYCNGSGIQVEHCYYDICSARDMTKLYYLNELINVCNSGDKIYIYDVSRFSRNTQQALNLLDIFSKKNIEVFSITDSCGYSTFSQKNMFRVLLSKAENDSDLLSQRIKDSISFRRNRGDFIGTPSYGYKCAKNTKGIRKRYVNNKEMAIIQFIKKLKYDNMKDYHIAEKLNTMKIKKRNKLWTPIMVKLLFKKYHGTGLIGMKTLMQSINKIDRTETKTNLNESSKRIKLMITTEKMLIDDDHYELKID
jgi:DNA invertase Pin-like site-specific DNA recombinase